MISEAYWYCVCPKCYGQGRLVIRKNKNTLFFQCDECGSAWSDAESIGDKKSIFLGFDLPSTPATKTEIIDHGWGHYMKKKYIT